MLDLEDEMVELVEVGFTEVLVVQEIGLVHCCVGSGTTMVCVYP